MLKSAYQFRWTMITWELPLDTREARRLARWFITVVARREKQFIGNVRRGRAIVSCSESKLREELTAACGCFPPPDGKVWLLGVTDKQYELSKKFWGARRATVKN